MLASKVTRLGRHAVPTRVATQPEAIAEAFHMREMNLVPGVVLGIGVPTATCHRRFENLITEGAGVSSA